MAIVLTKTPEEVFAPTTAGGAARGADMQDAMVLTREIFNGVKDSDFRIDQLFDLIAQLEPGVAADSVILLDPSGTEDWTTITASSHIVPLVAYSESKIYLLYCGGRNAAGATLNINGLGARTISEMSGDPVRSNRWNFGDLLILQYSASLGFQIMQPQTSHLHCLDVDPSNHTAITATSYGSTLAAYEDSALYWMVAQGPNDVDPSLNINGMGDRWIVEMDLSAPAAGRWDAGDLVLMQYSASMFQILLPDRNRDGRIQQAYTTAQEAASAVAYLGGKMAEQSFCGALLTRATTGTGLFPTGVATAVPWEAAEFDVGGWFDVSSPTEIRVPSSLVGLRGIDIDVQLLLDGEVGDVTLEIEKFLEGAWTWNFLGYSQRATPSVAGNQYCGGKWATGFIPAEPGDRFRLRITHSGGAARSFDAYLNQSMLAIRAIF